ncbi:17249_t:CDS:2, partial [Entrophospora sp. SA101]
MAELNTKTKQIRIKLINKINNLDEKELIACSQLFENMRYPDGTHQGEILTPYLQKKAMEWVLITKVFQNAVAKKFKANKNAHTPEFVSLATQMSNIGQMSLSSTVQCTKEIFAFLTGQSHRTLARWNKEVAQVVIHDNLPNKDCQFFSYGIIADESTRGEKKIFLVCLSYWSHHTNEPLLSIIRMVDIERCSAIVVCNTIIESCQSYNLCINKCLYWLTDNTGYMPGEKGGAVVEFKKKKTGSKTVRIPCGLHAIHIVVNAFEKITFGSNSNPSGLSLHPHPFNLLNLAYYLHNGYNDPDKDNPLNMKTETIKRLYWTFLQYQLKNYQKPISTRWLYQLETAKQYLDRKDIHLMFARSVDVLKKCARDIITSGLLSSVADPCPRIQHNGTIKTLPNDYRAHELPEMVEKWTKELNEAAERPEIVFFFEEFQAANRCLEKNDYIDLMDKIKAGLTKALDIFKKWMDIWTHLPLSVCNLGGNNGQTFAWAVICVILDFPLPNFSNNLVKARLKLSGPKPLECMLTSKKLKEVHAHQHIITPNPINLNF